MKPQFNQAEWDRHIKFAHDTAVRNNTTTFVRFASDISIARTVDPYIENHGWTSDLSVPTLSKIYAESDVFVKVTKDSLTIVNNGLNIPQENLISSFYKKLGIAYPPPPISFITKNRISKPIEAPIKEELWWQKEKRLAAERWDAVVALRKSVRSLLGM